MNSSRNNRIAFQSILLCLGMVSAHLQAATAGTTGDRLPIVPRPVESRLVDGEPFHLDSSTLIVCDANSDGSAARAVEAVRRVTGALRGKEVIS